ncbi:hypothetical protein V6N13_078302 [Hibiscus sabdariffa]
MAGKIKGIYKGFKSISQMFVVKEREMEIGQPTDVIHVSHIGGDHSSTSSPRWMSEFKTGPNKTLKPTGSPRVSHPTTLSTRSSQGTFPPNQFGMSLIDNFTCMFCKKYECTTDDQSIRSEARMKKLRNRSCTDLSNATEKRKRRRKSTSTSESSSTKSRRLSKTKTTSTQLDSSSDYEI